VPIEGVDLHFEQGSSYARSAADGTFSIENVAQGERILIYGRGEEIVELSVTIDPESVTEIELALGPEPVATATPRPTPSPTPSVEPSIGPTPSSQPSPTAPPTPPPAEGTFVYRAVSGDSLTGIARQFNAPYSEIYQLNPQYHDNPDFLPIGGEVVVPCTQIAIQRGYCN
jgi:LysM repeat protein